MNFDFIGGFLLGFVAAYYRKEIKDFFRSVSRALRDFRRAVAKQLLETLGNAAEQPPQPTPSQQSSVPKPKPEPPKKTESLL